MKQSSYSSIPRCTDDVSLKFLFRDIERYSRKKFLSDIWAAFAVALVSVPQALAYSFLLGVPPAAGILSMVLGTAIASLLSSSRHLVIGPNNATTLLVQAALVGIFHSYYVGLDPSLRGAISVQLIAVLTIFVGCFQLLAAVLKLGRLIQFVSHSVVIGYVTGTALAICVGQVFPLIGLVCPDSLDTVYEKIVYFVLHVKEAHFVTTLLGIGSIGLFWFLRRFSWRAPSTLIVIITSSILVLFLHLSEGSTAITLVGSSVIEPTFELHLFDMRFLNAFLPVAFAVALIGMLEANTIAKSLAVTTGQRIYGNQETFALGAANTLISFFGGLPCSGSASRSILNLESGAVTRFSAFFSGVFVIALVFLCADIIQYVPITVLAALLFMTALRLIDKAQVTLCWKATRSDLFVFMATFLACIFFSLPLAFYIGVTLSIILYLRKAAIPRVMEYVYTEETDSFHPIKEEEKTSSRQVRIINVEGELFFGAMDIFQYALRAIAEDDNSTKVFILRLKHVHDVDATTALAFKQLKGYLQKNGKHLVVCNIPTHVWALFDNSDLLDYFGRENLILHDNEDPHASLKLAVRRAREILV